MFDTGNRTALRGNRWCGCAWDARPSPTINKLTMPLPREMSLFVAEEIRTRKSDAGVPRKNRTSPGRRIDLAGSLETGLIRNEAESVSSGIQEDPWGRKPKTCV